MVKSDFYAQTILWDRVWEAMSDMQRNQFSSSGGIIRKLWGQTDKHTRCFFPHVLIFGSNMMKVLDSRASESDSYTFTQQSTRHCTAWNTTIKTKRKNDEAFTSKMLAINRLILLNLYSILFCTDGLWITIHQPNNPLQEEQHGYTQKSCKQR